MEFADRQHTIRTRTPFGRFRSGSYHPSLSMPRLERGNIDRVRAQAASRWRHALSERTDIPLLADFVKRAYQANDIDKQDLSMIVKDAPGEGLIQCSTKALSRQAGRIHIATESLTLDRLRDWRDYHLAGDNDLSKPELSMLTRTLVEGGHLPHAALETHIAKHGIDEGELGKFVQTSTVNSVHQRTYESAARYSEACLAELKEEMPVAFSLSGYSTTNPNPLLELGSALFLFVLHIPRGDCGAEAQIRDAMFTTLYLLEYMGFESLRTTDLFEMGALGEDMMEITRQMGDRTPTAETVDEVIREWAGVNATIPEITSILMAAQAMDEAGEDSDFLQVKADYESIIEQVTDTLTCMAEGFFMQADNPADMLEEYQEWRDTAVCHLSNLRLMPANYGLPADLAFRLFGNEDQRDNKSGDALLTAICYVQANVKAVGEQGEIADFCHTLNALEALLQWMRAEVEAEIADEWLEIDEHAISYFSSSIGLAETTVVAIGKPKATESIHTSLTFSEGFTIDYHEQAVMSGESEPALLQVGDKRQFKIASTLVARNNVARMALSYLGRAREEDAMEIARRALKNHQN